MGDLEPGKTPVTRKGLKRDRQRDLQLVDSGGWDQRSEAQLREAFRQKLADLSKLLGLRDQRILALTKREAALAARITALETAERLRLSRTARRAHVRRQRFLNSPAGWACRGFFRIPLTAIRIVNFLLGGSFPRVRVAAEQLDRLLAARQWRAFIASVRTRIGNRVRAVTTNCWSIPLATLRDRRLVAATVVVFASEDEEELQATIRSIRAQTLARLEILVVRRRPQAAPGSRPRVAPDYRELATDVAAPSDAIVLARGKYVCCLQAGERIAPTYLEKCLYVLEDDLGCGMAYSHASGRGEADEQTTGDFDSREPLTPVCIAPHAVFRRSMAVSLRGERKSTQDLGRAFWSSLARACRRGRAVPEHLVMLAPARAQMICVAWPPPDTSPWQFDKRAWTAKSAAPRRRQGGRKFSLLARPLSVDTRPHALVVVPWLPRGGAETLLLDVLRHLTRNWRLSIVTTIKDSNEMAAEFAAVVPEIFHLAELVEPDSRADAIIALARSRGSRVILSSGAVAYYAALDEIKSNLPSLRTVDILHNDTSHIGDAVRASRSIDRHVAVSYRVAASLAQQGVPRDRIAVIPNGVDVNGAFSLDRVNRSEVRERLEIAPDTFVVTFVGRLAHEKRPDAFLEIVAALQRTAGVQALMVGDGPLADEVDLAIHQQQLSVRRIASVERALMHEIYAASDLLIAPSKVEGMPLAVLEALAMGCPVAATAAGDVERIIVRGYNGYVVPIGDPRALVPLIRELVRNPKRHAAMRAAAHRSVRASGATLETMAARYEQLLDKVTGRRAEREPKDDQVNAFATIEAKAAVP